MGDLISIQNKVIVLTGAADGIGHKVAHLLGEEGARLILADVNAEGLQKVVQEIQSQGGTALACPTDLRKADQIAQLVRVALDQFERIDVLINNAGMAYYEWIEEMTAEELRQQYEVNILGMAELIRQVVPVMKHQCSGHIINMASYASRIAAPPLTVYSSTKYAVEGLTDGLRRELAPWNIKVTRVHPDAVNTSFNEKAAQGGGVRFPFSKLTGVSREDVARQIVKAIKKPKRAVFVSRIPLLSNLAVVINRQLPFLLDRAFKVRVPKMWKEHEDHDTAEDLVFLKRRMG